MFIGYVSDPLSVNTGNGTITSPGRGEVHLSFRCSDGTYRPIRLLNVHYSPTSRLNIVSEWILEQRQVYWRGELNRFVHLPIGEELFEVRCPDGLKLIDVRVATMSQQHALVVPSPPLNLDMLHLCLAHLSLEGMKEYLKQEKLELPDPAPFHPCEGCARAKSTRQVCRVPHTRATVPFQKVHLDTVGPLMTIGLGSCRYYIILTYDFSRYRSVSTLVLKGQGFTVIESFFAMVRT